MNNDLLNIENIKYCLKQKNVYWTNHCLNRLNQRDILISDVKNAINNGKIIEYYYNDYPYHSCLIIGSTKNNEILHIVCGVSASMVYIITAYYPNINKWENDMKTRRKD